MRQALCGTFHGDGLLCPSQPSGGSSVISVSGPTGLECRPSLHSFQAVLPRGQGWRDRELGKGQVAGGWAAMKAQEGEAGGAARLICGENRSAEEQESLWPGCWGAGWRQSRAWAPLLDIRLASTPQDAQSRERSFLEVELLPGGSGSRAGHDTSEADVFYNLDTHTHMQAGNTGTAGCGLR